MFQSSSSASQSIFVSLEYYLFRLNATETPNVVSRLKDQWADEHALWNQRDLSNARWVYWWADGIHTGLRSDDSDSQCRLVIIGVKPDGKKERVAIGDGFRESKDAWCELLLDLKARGLQSGPLLAAGDRAMGLLAPLAHTAPGESGAPHDDLIRSVSQMTRDPALGVLPSAKRDSCQQ